MERTRITLTVCFAAPFWIGLVERRTGQCYEVCKITFGAEPKDYEVWDYLLKNWRRLRFSLPVKLAEEPEPIRNPKRLQREIRKQLQESAGIGTKAQQALQLQREQNKRERKIYSREQKEQEKQRRFALRQERRKQKHRGH